MWTGNKWSNGILECSEEKEIGKDGIQLYN